MNLTEQINQCEELNTRFFFFFFSRPPSKPHLSRAAAAAAVFVTRLKLRMQ
jgi:hypothetical protein